MSNSNFDSVETTLQSLREIVDRNHSDASLEPSELVRQMEVLIQEIKTKNKLEAKIQITNHSNHIPHPHMGIPNIAPVVI